MNYKEYYKGCLLTEPKYDIDTFTFKVLDFTFDVKNMRADLFKDIDKVKAEEWIKKISYKSEYLNVLKPVFDVLIPYLENEIYCSYVLIDKVYIYRTIYYPTRTTSTLYHYDNTPPTMLKTIIYLNDVLDDSDGPIEFCKDYVVPPTRQGPNHWFAPPNNSRLTDNDVKDKEKVKVFGKAGTSTLFYPSCIHRANPPAVGKIRDVINIVTQPTHDKSETYKYISGYEENGSPLIDPRQRRSIKYV